jgi:hypothetical protein
MGNLGNHFSKAILYKNPKVSPKFKTVFGWNTIRNVGAPVSTVSFFGLNMNIDSLRGHA